MPSERSRLHRQAAATLEAAPDLLGCESAAHAIALHWAAGRDNDKAFAWSVRAARLGSAAHFESLQMYERVLQFWDLVDEPTAAAGEYAAVLEAAARTAKDAGDYERALELATRALEATASEDHQGRFSRLVLHLHLLIDLIQPGADRDAAEAEALLDRLIDDRFRAHAVEQLASHRMNSGGDAGCWPVRPWRLRWRSATPVSNRSPAIRWARHWSSPATRTTVWPNWPGPAS